MKHLSRAARRCTAAAEQKGPTGAQDADAGELHAALCHLAFEANRTMFAVTNQLRAALSQETFGYLRALHQTSTKSLSQKSYQRL